MTDSKFTRRAMLRAIGLGSSAALLPLLQSDLVKGDTHDDTRKRCAIMFFGNGVLGNHWWPDQDAGPLVGTLPECTSPLASHLDQLTFIRNLSIASQQADARDGAPGAHSALVSLLTGVRSVSTPYTKPNGNPGLEILGAGGPSVDQYIARALSQRDPRTFDALTLGVQCGGGDRAENRLIHAGPQRPVTPREDPWALFATMFADMGDGEELQRLRRERRSVLDLASRRLEVLQFRVGREDLHLIEGHLESVRQLERRLSGTDASSCSMRSIPDSTSALDPKNFARVAEAQIDLMILAFRCGLTRVATLQMANGAGNNTIFPWLGDQYAQDPGCWDYSFDECPSHCGRNTSTRECTHFHGGVGTTRPDAAGWFGHHSLAHAAGNALSSWHELKRGVDQWFARMYGRLLDGLSSSSEGDGTLLDSSAVLLVSNMRDGGSHSMTDTPVILAGGAGGALRPAGLVEADGDGGQPLNRLWHTLIEAMDVDPSEFNSGEFRSDPLALS